MNELIGNNTANIAFITTLALIIIIGLPQAWRDSNSWWFTPIKFWFYIFPFLIGSLGIISMGVGPITAIFGLFFWSPMTLITIFYLYYLVIIYFMTTNKYQELKEKLSTL